LKDKNPENFLRKLPHQLIFVGSNPSSPFKTKSKPFKTYMVTYIYIHIYILHISTHCSRRFTHVSLQFFVHPLALSRHGCFSILGEAMTQRLRVAILTSMFRQVGNSRNSRGMEASIWVWINTY
jgi:hypothetical protein